MDIMYNKDGSIKMKAGWEVVCTEDQHPSLNKLKQHQGPLIVNDIIPGDKYPLISLKGYPGWYWIGWFMKAVTKFKKGDKVKYTKTLSEELVGKILTVKETQDFGLSNCMFLIFEGMGHTHHNAEHFEKVEYPDFKEMLFDFCSENIITEGKDLYLDIENYKVQQTGVNYTKNDLMKVLRVLEKYHVRSTICFDSELQDRITVKIYAEDIMEELLNNSSPTLPITALEELCNEFEVWASITDHNYYYTLGFGCIVYHTEDTSPQVVPMGTTE